MTEGEGVAVQPEQQEPRVASLHALMRDIGALRRQIETDLTLTAAALEHAELEVADGLLAGSLRHLDAFDRDAQLHLGAREPLPAPVTYLRPTRRSRFGVREAAVAAAAAAVAAAFLVLPGSPEPTTSLVSALPDDQVVGVEDPRVADQVVQPDEFAQATVELAALTVAPAPAPAEILRVSEQLATTVRALSRTRLAADPDAGGRALAALSVERDLLRDHDADGSLATQLSRNELLTTTLKGVLQSLGQPLLSVLSPPAPSAAPRVLPTD